MRRSGLHQALVRAKSTVSIFPQASAEAARDRRQSLKRLSYTSINATSTSASAATTANSQSRITSEGRPNSAYRNSGSHLLTSAASASNTASTSVSTTGSNTELVPPPVPPRGPRTAKAKGELS